MNHRYDFLFLFDCQDANPNGDPDAGNLPRIDVETGQGLVTDVCIKRKIRNFVHLTKSNGDEHEIFIQEKRPLNPLLDAACERANVPTHYNSQGERGKAEKDAVKQRPQEEIQLVQKWLCKRYFDIRAFGGVLSTGPNCGQIRGPVQLSFARSISPIVSSEHTITRLTDVDKEEGEMGRKFTIPYGLYKAQGFVNPYLALQTGFDDEDLELLFQSLENAFQFDQSAARPAGSMAPRKLIVFKHQNQLGKAPSHKLFDAVQIKKKDGVEVPRSFSDYEVSIDRSAIPEGVEIIERI